MLPDTGDRTNQQIYENNGGRDEDAASVGGLSFRAPLVSIVKKFVK